jgi:hypothetical protein
MEAKVQPKQPGDPRRLGPYELVGRLGQGGMGVVFLGRERRGGRLAAVKALRPELAGDATFAARFRREVEAARRVDSPRVARVLDADPTATRPWLATEYVEGATLADAVATDGPLTGTRLVGFASGVASALTAIHAAGVVHRDLKATNVLLQHDLETPGAATLPLDAAAPGAAGPVGSGVKVIDFGIAWAADATMTRSGLRFGTPSWMAPEQLRDRPAGPPADVFAWGLLVAFAATGRHPFGGGRPEAVAYRILHDQPDLAGVPASVRDLVRDALARDPADRPTAARLAAALVVAPPPTLPLPVPGPTRVLPIAGAAEVGRGPSGAPGSVATGPTRRRRGRRVGGLLVALALLVGLVTAPHIVLAAVESPGDPAALESSAKDCSEDHEAEEEKETRDPDDAVEARDDEDEPEEAEEGAARARDEDAKGRDEGAQGLDGSGGAGKSAGADASRLGPTPTELQPAPPPIPAGPQPIPQPTPTRSEPRPDPAPDPSAPVLGS